MHRTIGFLCCLLLAACGDSSSTLNGDGGRADGKKKNDGSQTNTDGTHLNDGSVGQEGSIEEGGSQDTLNDGGAKDAPSDGVINEDGSTGDGSPGDGSMNDGSFSDVPYVFDGPYGDGTFIDGPYAQDGSSVLFDGPAGDGASSDGTSSGDLFNVPDLYLWDGMPLIDAIVGLNEAGVIMCLNALNQPVLCECNDGIDNDQDGDTDYPADPGCIGPWDNTELGGPTQCNNGIDDDGDNLIDAADPECTGPLDNDESSFATGIKGDNMDACKQDCFFDGNSGGGDDGCEWNLKCDPLSPGEYLPKPCPYDPTYKNCPEDQFEKCLKNCRRITPNGCDCFGCCALSDGVLTKWVILTDSCNAAVLDQPTLCPPCTPVDDCLNPCGPCEVCVGQPVPDPSCFPILDGGMPSDGGPFDGSTSTDGSSSTSDGSSVDGGGGTPFCPGGEIYCGPGGIDPNQCPVGTYCITGCCISIVEN